MTDQELKDLVASLAIQSAKNHAETAKNNAQIAKNNAQIAKNNAAYEKRMAKNDAETAKNNAERAKNNAERAKDNAAYEKRMAKNDAERAKDNAERAKDNAAYEKRMAKNDAERAKDNAETAKNNAERAKDNAAYEKRMAKNDAERAKNNAAYEKRMAKNDAERAETAKLVKALTKDIFGISTSMGLEAEDFFYSALSSKLQLAGVNFDYAYKDDKSNIKGKKQQIDILLENGDAIAVVEVKNKVRIDAIEQLDNIIQNFVYFHPQFKGYKLYGAIAGKVFPDYLKKLVLKKGYSVLTQKGEHMELVNP